MAVTQTGFSPIKVTGTSTAGAPTEVTTEMVRVKRVRWYNPTSLGDLLTLTDSGGSEILQDRCQSSGDSQTSDIDATYEGILIPDMDSGTVYIYIERTKV